MSQMARLSLRTVMQRAAANSVTTIIEGISQAVGNAFPIIWEHSSWQMPLFASHYGSTFSSSFNSGSGHVCCFLNGSLGRNHSETCAGCIVSCTTANNRSRN